MMKVKKIIATVVSVLVLFQNTFPIYGEEIYISSMEIEERIDEVFDRYNIEHETLSIDDSVLYTEEEVANELRKLDLSIQDSICMDSNIATASTSSVQRLMPVTEYPSTTAYLSNGVTGGATFVLSCTAVINVDRDIFMSISNIKARQYGSYTNMKSWQQISSGYSYDKNQTQAKVEAVVTLVTEANILGVVKGVTMDHSINMIVQV